MAIVIREYLGSEGLEVDWNCSEQMNVNLDVKESIDTIPPDSLMVDIEGIHVGATRNFTWYTEQALQSSVPTWTKPYMRPLIMHHNEKDGKIIGRINFVTYVDKNTRSGTGALLFTANVPDKEGKEQIKDGRLKTVSIGAIVHDCRCSVCGQNIAEDGECEHKRGEKYDGKVCYWMIYSMEAKELSYVIVPSDIYAQNVRIYNPSKADMNMAANYHNEGVLNVSEATQIDPTTGLPVTEATTVDENGEKPAETTPPVAPAQSEPAAGPDAGELQKKIEDLEGQVKDLKDQVSNLEKDKDTLTTAAATAEKDLETTKVLLDQAQTTINTTKAALTTKESELATEKTLRETAETQVIELNTQAKNSMVENIMYLRQALGKPTAVKEELEKRSEDSLKDAINDLKEEFSGQSKVTNITQVSNPGLVETKDESGTDVKESKNAGNIDLAEGLEKIFDGIIGAKAHI